MRGALYLFNILMITGCGAATTGVHGTTTSADQTPEADGAPSDEVISIDDVPDEALEFLRSIDELPFPHLDGRQMVRVYTGRPLLGRNEEREEAIPGVLIQEELFAFTVVHGLSPVTYQRGDSGYGSDVRYEPVSWTEVLEHAITTARARVDAENDDEYLTQSMLDDRLGPRLRAALLARAALANGYEREARELLALALRMDGPSMPFDDSDSPVASLRGDLALHLFTLATDAYQDLDVDRPELLTQLRSLAQRFEGTEAARLSSYYADILERMIAEDEAHERRRTNLSQVDELLYRLRDDREAEIDLERMGLQVTPSLIPLLADDRLTRQVSCDGRYVRWETYGEVAWILLRRLSGERFDTTEAAQRWWEEVQRVGETEMLVRRIREGDYLALDALEQLMARDQERAVQEGMAVARNAEERLRSSMIRVLAEAGQALPTRFLLEQVRSGPLSSRLEAAEALDRRGNTQWIEPMVEQVREYLEANPEGGEGFNSMVVLDVLELLVEQGGDQGLSALRELYPRLRRQFRFELLMAASQVHTGDTATSTRVNSLLVDAIDDHEPILRVPLALRQSGSDCLYIGDAAAFTLASRLGVTFDCTAPPYARARARVEIVNRWRTNRGESPVALPPEPPPAHVDEAGLEAALRRVRAVSRPEELGAALDALRALGPGAARRTAEMSLALADHHPAKTPSLRLASELASTVTALTIDDQALPIANRSALEHLRGQPLSSQSLPRLLMSVVSSTQRGELLISAYRDGEGRGVSLSITSRPSEEDAFLRAEVDLFYAFRAGDGDVRDDVDYFELVEALGRRGYLNLEENVGDVLDAPPDTDGEILLVIKWSH